VVADATAPLYPLKNATVKVLLKQRNFDLCVFRSMYFLLD